MKIIKKILLALFGIIALLLIVALFTKKEYAVEREIAINKPKQVVFDYVKIVRNQEKFNVWNMLDPQSIKEYKGTDGTVGFIYSWDSQNEDVGKGEQEIKSIKEGERVDFELRFTRPFVATGYAYMTTENISENSTKVKWGFNGKMDYPKNIFLLFMNMDKNLGKDLYSGLENLKRNLETSNSQ